MSFIPNNSMCFINYNFYIILINLVQLFNSFIKNPLFKIFLYYFDPIINFIK